MMTSPFDHVCQFHHQEGRVLVSFSGGPDSVFLVYALKSAFQSNDIQLVYFDHHLRSDHERRQERSFVTHFAKSEGLACRIKSLPVSAYAQSKKVSLEMAGRELRYRWLCHLASLRGITTVMTGHHQDDLVETVLLRLVQGTKRGVQGISERRQIQPGLFLERPLLALSKKTILETLDSRQIAYSIDSSNADVSIDRNCVRHEVMPLLTQVNTAASLHIGQFSRYMNRCFQFIDDHISGYDDLIQCDDGSYFFDIDVFVALSDFIQEGFIYRVLVSFYQDRLCSDLISQPPITEKHVHSVWELCSHEGVGACHLPLGVFVFKDQQRLYITLNHSLLETPEYRYDILINARITVPEAGCVCSVVEEEQSDVSFKSTDSVAFVNGDLLSDDRLCVRNRRQSDTFQPFGMDGHKRLQDYFVDCKVSVKDRSGCPLFCDGDTIVWVSGYQISERYRVRANTKRILKLVIAPI